MTDTELPGTSFLRYVLESLVENKDQLVIDSQEDELGVLHTITVAEADMGKLIGKGGQTIKALRTLVRIIGSNEAKRVNLKVQEPAAA